MISMLSSWHRRALRLTSHFLLPYRWHAFGALLALIVTAGITLSMGQGIKLLVDQGFMTRSPHLLNQSIGLFMLLVLGLAVGTFARFYLVSWIGERVVADIRRQVFNHLVYLHPGFYEDNRSSEIQSRLTADTTLLQSVIGSSLSLFLRNLLMVIGGVVLLFITNPKLTSIVVIALPLVIAPILLSADACAICRARARIVSLTSAATFPKPSGRSKPCKPITIKSKTSSASPRRSSRRSRLRVNGFFSAHG